MTQKKKDTHAEKGWDRLSRMGLGESTSLGGSVINIQPIPDFDMSPQNVPPQKNTNQPVCKSKQVITKMHRYQWGKTYICLILFWLQVHNIKEYVSTSVCITLLVFCGILAWWMLHECLMSILMNVTACKHYLHHKHLQ